VANAEGMKCLRHQVEFVEKVKSVSKIRVVLADDAGMGKTTQVALLLRALINLGRISSVLIVTPASSLCKWERELRRLGVEFGVLEGAEASSFHCNVCLVTVDRAKEEEYLEELKKRKWDLVVVDRAHVVKRGRKRFNISAVLRNAGGCVLTVLPQCIKQQGNPRRDEDCASLVRLFGEDKFQRSRRSDAKTCDGVDAFPPLRRWVVRVKVDGGVGGLEDVRKRGVRELVDEKFETFMALLHKLRGGGWKRFVVFTSNRDMAKRLLDNLAQGCVRSDQDGNALADCGWLGVVYLSGVAQGGCGDLPEKFLEEHDVAVLIVPEAAAEAIDFSAFNVVVNYDIAKKPETYIWRVTRVWNVGQKAGGVLVVDMVAEGAEYDKYVRLVREMREMFREDFADLFANVATEVYEAFRGDIRIAEANAELKTARGAEEGALYAFLGVPKLAEEHTVLSAVMTEGRGSTIRVANEDFRRRVESVVAANRLKAFVEVKAAECAIELLKESGYRVVYEYERLPGPFDLVVEKDGVVFTVEVKGKSADKADEPIIFTVSEKEWAQNYADYHIVCVAYVEKDGRCKEVECAPFSKLRRPWVVEDACGEGDSPAKSSNLQPLRGSSGSI